MPNPKSRKKSQISNSRPPESRRKCLGAWGWELSWSLGFGIWSLCCPSAIHAQTLALPARATNALSGTEVVRRIAPLDLPEREKEIVSQITSGNVPNFLRTLAPVQVTNVVACKTNA